jgi:hypothetical protein
MLGFLGGEGPFFSALRLKSKAASIGEVLFVREKKGKSSWEGHAAGSGNQ